MAIAVGCAPHTACPPLTHDEGPAPIAERSERTRKKRRMGSSPAHADATHHAARFTHDAASIVTEIAHASYSFARNSPSAGFRRKSGCLPGSPIVLWGAWVA